jgi:hypothetical protein
MHDITDAFLNANANQEFIASTLTSVLRDLMRATAVKHDHVSAVVTAAESWKLLLQLLERCEQPAPWGELFEEAVKRLRDDGRPEGDDVSEALREVARTGMSIYIEGRTGGFSSVKQQAFMVAIDHLEEKRRRRPELSTQKERGRFILRDAKAG